MTETFRSPAAGLARLRDLAVRGGLDELCERHGVALPTAFGSTVRGADVPRDLDLAVLHEPGRRVDYLPLIDGLQRAAGTDVDLAVLDTAGPVLRERALVGAEPLYESRDGREVRRRAAPLDDLTGEAVHVERDVSVGVRPTGG